MPKFDFKCENGHLREDVYVRLFEDKNIGHVHSIVLCLECGQNMTRQPAAPNFSVKGFSAKNGYSR